MSNSKREKRKAAIRARRGEWAAGHPSPAGRMRDWMRSTEDPDTFRTYVICNVDAPANDVSWLFQTDRRTGRRYVHAFTSRAGAERFLAGCPARQPGDRVYELTLPAFLAWLRECLRHGNGAFRVDNTFEVQAAPFVSLASAFHGLAPAGA